MAYSGSKRAPILAGIQEARVQRIVVTAGTTRKSSKCGETGATDM